MKTLRFVLCDVFSDVPLSGNQLAVFMNAQGLTSETMQALAREMHFSESTFVSGATDGGHFKLRIFTPEREVPFAGHPILGSAAVIGASVQLDELRLETEAGIVPVRLEREGATVRYCSMQQPLPRSRSFEREQELQAALGIEGSELPIVLSDNGIEHVLVAVASPEIVATLHPALDTLGKLHAGTISVFAKSGDRIKTRVFAPGAGVPEDPATGSAAGALIAHLAQHGWVRYGDLTVIEQGAELNRPSTIYATAEQSEGELSKVVVGGSVVSVARGEFRLPLV